MARTFTGLDEFRAQLEAAGWRIYRNGLASENNACDWYATSPEKIAGPNCECNDKPPQLVAWPHQFNAAFVARYSVQHNPGSVELDITGERGEQWLKLAVYGMSTAEFFDRLPLASRQLAAAWRAAAEA